MDSQQMNDVARAHAWKRFEHDHRFHNGRSRTQGYIYIIRSSEKLNNRFIFKVGKSIAPDIRIQNIAGGLPFDVCLIGVFECSAALAVEKFIHVTMQKYHVRSEWFAFSDEACNFLLTILGDGEGQELPDPYEPILKFIEVKYGS